MLAPGHSASDLWGGFWWGLRLGGKGVTECVKKWKMENGISHGIPLDYAHLAFVFSISVSISASLPRPKSLSASLVWESPS